MKNRWRNLAAAARVVCSPVQLWMSDDGDEEDDDRDIFEKGLKKNEGKLGKGIRASGAIEMQTQMRLPMEKRGKKALESFNISF